MVVPSRGGKSAPAEIAAIFPPSMEMLRSGLGAAPAPSMMWTCSRTALAVLTLSTCAPAARAHRCAGLVRAAHMREPKKRGEEANRALRGVPRPAGGACASEQERCGCIFPCGLLARLV